MDKRIDLALAVGVVTLGVALFGLTFSINEGTVHDPVGTRGALQFLGLLMAAAGVALTVRRLRGWPDQPRLVRSDGSKDDSDHPASGLRPLGIVALGLAFALLLEPLGFLILTPPVLAGLLLLMRVRALKVLVGYSLGLTLIVFCVFVGMFDVLLPLGPLLPFQDVLWFQV
jgi:putative tricarboxylic transport membrane protein